MRDENIGFREMLNSFLFCLCLGFGIFYAIFPEMLLQDFGKYTLINLLFLLWPFLLFILLNFGSIIPQKPRLLSNEPSPVEWSEEDFIFNDYGNGGYVYLLSGDEYTKIGKANDASSRVKQISPILPFETEIIYTIYTNNPLKLELKLHRIFSDRRANGEWFLLSESDIQEIKNIGEFIHAQ